MRGFPSKRSSKAVFKVPTRYITSPDSLKSNYAKPCLIGTMDARHFRQILRKCQASFRRQHQFWNVLILQAHGPPRWLWRFYKTSMWSLAAKKRPGGLPNQGCWGGVLRQIPHDAPVPNGSLLWGASDQPSILIGGASGGPQNITYHPNVLYS